MTYRIPPLNALRAFESAARHLSFKQAATELGVTPGAVCQQVKILEEVLGLRLFERIHNGLTLTAKGRHYLAPVRRAFTGISDATEMISPRGSGADLTIGADLTFLIRWLMPRMAAFQHAHPDLRTRIAEVSSAEAVADGEVDIALLQGVSAHGALRCELVFEEALFPVGAPALIERAAFDLAGTILLVADDRAIWSAWLERAGEPGLADLDRLEVADHRLAIEAALAGGGLAMGSSLREQAELADGRLAPVMPPTAVGGAAYYAILPPGRAACPAEAAFMAWLRDRRPAAPG